MRIGVKSGCFTLLTAGHIRALKFAKQHCDHLIVINNDDHYIYNKKGVVPIEAQQRLEILKSIIYVDEVYTYSGTNEHFWLNEFKKEQLVQRFGADAKLIIFHAMYIRSSTFIPGHNVADEVIYIPDFDCSSVSDIFSRIRGKNENRI